MHKYPDLYRIRYDHIQMVTSKRYWEDPRHLFKNISIIEEKIDGSQMAIGWKHDAPYVQGKNSHIDQSDKRMAYHGVWAWIWENVAKLQKLKGKLVFGEWMRVRHSLEYDLLPDWFIAFDVYDLEKGQSFLDEFDDDSHWTSHRFQENKLKVWSV